MHNIHTHRSHGTAADEIISRSTHFDQSVTLPQCSLGLHPWYLDDAEVQWKALLEYADRPNVLAIGECGLDKACDTPWEIQTEYFEKQIALANTLQKPLIIHCVKAYQECLLLLKAAKVPVVFHGFNKNTETAKMLLARGYFLSFGHQLLKESYADTFREIPVTQMCFETDDQPELLIEDVYKRAAEMLNFPLDALILQIEKNYQNIFRYAR
ncbi:TatD family hydrolase [Taibaiella sp. KBW10]|uniref:TatD family hydrolase n=1 Tax=Taibaiella sp. KBW10 TaxID=2153357 RepID=UPI0013157C78|nr:TatD family hydrolase [Taibaiella sp. KBW10]